MTDRDIVIRSVESCFDYWLDQHRCLHPLELDDVRQMKSDAIALLKEREAVKPTWSRGKPFCGACGLRIHGGKFCSECGKPILWEGR